MPHSSKDVLKPPELSKTPPKLWSNAGDWFECHSHQGWVGDHAWRPLWPGKSSYIPLFEINCHILDTLYPIVCDKFSFTPLFEINFHMSHCNALFEIFNFTFRTCNYRIFLVLTCCFTLSLTDVSLQGTQSETETVCRPALLYCLSVATIIIIMTLIITILTSLSSWCPQNAPHPSLKPQDTIWDNYILHHYIELCNIERFLENWAPGTQLSGA